jgi:aromatic ring-cleaving dioxygenase
MLFTLRFWDRLMDRIGEWHSKMAIPDVGFPMNAINPYRTLTWLGINRRGLVVFVHAVRGEDGASNAQHLANWENHGVMFP